MPTKTRTISYSSISALIEKDERQQLRHLLNEMHPVDLAQTLSEMEKPWRLYCFRLLDLENAGAVLSDLESSEQSELLKELGDLSVVPIIARMAPDEAVDLLSALPKQKAGAIISQMTDLEAAEDLQELLSFKEGTAGRIMSTEYLAVPETTTVENTLKHFQQMQEDVEEDLYDIYVVNDQNQLLGRLTVKELLSAKDPAVQVGSIMDPETLKVHTTTDQEEAAEQLRRYHLLSLPVVDTNDELRGVITAADVIDVLQEEASEDLFQSSGINATSDAEGELFKGGIGFAFKARVPWLVFVLLIETISAFVIGHFGNVIRQTVAAAAFMPLLSAVTGSAAVQSTCIAMRASTDRSISSHMILRGLFHELKVGVLLGIACGMVTFALGFLFHANSYILGLFVGLSLLITMVIGLLVGTVTPWIFQKLGIDPAHASGPLISSLLDVFTFTIYLSIVHCFLAQISPVS
jgi:magnesium transporter